MDDHLIVIFQTEVELQCRFVLFGMAQLERVRRHEVEQTSRIQEAKDATFADADWYRADDPFRPNPGREGSTPVAGRRRPHLVRAPRHPVRRREPVQAAMGFGQ
jgi:hypothetical protein